jgi:hypothetical protein
MFRKSRFLIGLLVVSPTLVASCSSSGLAAQQRDERWWIWVLIALVMLL